MKHDNPFLRRANKGGSGAVGRKSERRVARALNCRPTPASGALPGAKGDMRQQGQHKWLIEAKATAAESLSLKREWLTKITKEANAVTSYPVVTVDFVHSSGEPKDHGSWVMIPRWVLRELTEDFE